ncbi:MAG: OsmC family protein [Alphaproteobacteria bacterium]|nr:OsmC family protein [Alphaproteobacteria bacterium]
MAELTLAYQAKCNSIGVAGRSICNARNHHWVAENTGGEAVGAGELFCASIAACAVNMVETIASNEQRALAGMEVNVAAYRDFDKPSGDVSLYDKVHVEFELWGVSDDDARFLVKTWKQR